MVGLERQRRAPRPVAAVEPGVGGERGEARVRGMVADVVGEDRERVHPRRTAARDRDDRRVADLRDGRGGVARRRSDHRRRPGHRRQQPTALVERYRVGADLADVVERDRLRADEAVADRQDRLRDDRQRRVVEEVVGLGYRPDEGALDGEHAVGALARGHCLDDPLERWLRHEAGRREQPVAGRCAVGALAPRVGDRVVVLCHVLLPFGVGPPDQLAGAGGVRVRRLAPKGEGKGERKDAMQGGRSPSRQSRRVRAPRHRPHRGSSRRRRRRVSAPRAGLRPLRRRPGPRRLAARARGGA